MAKILLIIAARGGSKGVPGKNIREIVGKPLIAHSILQARKWGKASRIICSTDSEAIAATALKYGAEVPFIRPQELAGDDVGKLAVIRHALKRMEEITGGTFEVIVDLDATAPIRTIADIDGAYQLFLKKKPKSVFSVVPARKNPYFNMVEIGRRGYAEIVKKSAGTVLRRQDANKVYDMNASIYIYGREYLLDESSNSAVTDQSLAWIMSEDASVDIDSERDFQFIEYLAAKGLVKL